MNMEQDFADKVIEEMEKNNEISHHFEKLSSDHLRKKYWREHYMGPTQIYLGQDSMGNSKFCQYIDIKESLHVLLQQQSVTQNFRDASDTSPGMLVD